MSNRLLAPALSALALMFAAPAVFAQTQTVTIDNHVIRNEKGSTVTFPKIEVRNTNLSREEVLKLFSTGTSKEDGTALLKKMKAERVSIPSVQLDAKDGKGTLRDFEASGIEAGRLKKFSVASLDMAGQDKQGKPIAIKSGPLLLEDGDFTSIVAAVTTGDPSNIQPRVGKLAWSGLDISVAEDGPKERTGQIRIALGKFEMDNKYDGDVFRSGTSAIRNLVIEPSKGSKMARDMAPIGYDKLDLGMTTSGSYDPVKKTLVIDDWTISGAGAGALTLKAAMGGLDKSAFAADRNAQLAALIGADASRLELKFDNKGLFEKVVAFVGQQQKKDAGALRKEWAAMAGQLLPAVLGGDPAALAVAGEVQKFLGDAKSLTLVATPKAGGAIKFIDLANIKDPMAFSQKVKVEAAANK